MNKIILIALTCLSLSVFADFKTLSTEQFQAQQKAGVAVIDIRRLDEYQKYGIIPNSHKMTFFDKNGKYNTPKWLLDLAKIVPTKDTPFILVCAHANRTKTVGWFLSNKVGYKNVQELSGGIINGWIDKGLATTKLDAKTVKPWYQIW